MAEENQSLMQHLDALGESFRRRLDELGEYLQNIVFEQVDNFMNGLIGKLSGMAEGISTSLSSGVSRVKDSISAAFTPSATPGKARSLDAGPAIEKEHQRSDIQRGEPQPEISAILEKTGFQGMQQFQCEEVSPDGDIHSGCMSASMARQNAVMAAQKQEEMARSLIDGR